MRASLVLVGFVLSLGLAAKAGSLPQPDNLQLLNSKKYSLNFSWSKLPQNNITYKVFRDGVLIGKTSNNEFKDVSLLPNRSYSYQISAVAGNDESVKSGAVKLSTVSDNSFLSNLPNDTENKALVKYYSNGLQKAFNAYANFIAQKYQTSDRELITLKMQREFKQYWNSYYNINTKIPYKTDKLSNFHFTNIGLKKFPILSSGKTSFVAATFSGYFFVEKTGSHTFDFDFDDGVIASIDGTVFVEEAKNGKYSKKIVLTEGIHHIKCRYFNFDPYSKLNITVYDSQNNLKPLNGFSLWQINDQRAANLIAAKKDSDFDGLSDLDEITLGTNPNNADTDNDGISDYDEVHKYTTNPNSADSDGDGVSDSVEISQTNSDPNSSDIFIDSYKEIATINGANYSFKTGEWLKKNSSAVSDFCNGELNYTININKSGIYQLSVDARLCKGNDYNLLFYCDKQLLGAENFKAKKDAAKTFKYFTQFLTPGKHNFKVYFNNATPANKLTVAKIKLLQPCGPDYNKDGVDDWFAAIKQQHSNLALASGSKVSPVIFEGVNKHAALLKITSNNTSKDVSLLSSDSWYYPAALSEDATKNMFEFNFQNGLNSKIKNVQWLQTNIIAEHGIIYLKKGDSLLLNAQPKIGSATGFIKIDDAVKAAVSAAKPLKYKFDTAKDYTITGSYPDADGNTISNTVKVKVIDYKLKTVASDIPLLLNKIKKLTFASDNRVKLVASDKLKMASSKAGSNVRLQLKTASVEPVQSIVARCCKTGRIMDVVTFSPQHFWGINDNTPFYVKKILDDGTMVIELVTICTPVAKDRKLIFKAYLPGMLFEDGTAIKEFTAEDFDETGMVKVKIIKAAEGLRRNNRIAESAIRLPYPPNQNS